MKKEDINIYFRESYLTCGITRDNFITTNCPKDFLSIALELLSISHNSIKPININLTQETESYLEKIFEYCTEDFQKKILARDYITSSIMLEAYRQHNLYPNQIKAREDHLQAFEKIDFNKVIEYHSECPLPFEISRHYRKYGKFEINFFLEDTQNQFVQQAINNLISERNPISIKLFATMEKLPSYVDECGSLIQSPHDYMQLNINNFLNKNEFERTI